MSQHLSFVGFTLLPKPFALCHSEGALRLCHPEGAKRPKDLILSKPPEAPRFFAALRMTEGLPRMTEGLPRMTERSLRVTGCDV